MKTLIALFIFFASSTSSISHAADAKSFQDWYQSYETYYKGIDQDSSLSGIQKSIEINSNLAKQLATFDSLTSAQSLARDKFLNQLKFERIALSIRVSTLEDSKIDVDNFKTVSFITSKAADSRAEALKALATEIGASVSI